MDLPLIAGTLYTFQIIATNAAGTAVIGSTTGTPFTTPGAPTLGTVAGSTNTATISLTKATPNNGDSITGYQYALTASTDTTAPASSAFTSTGVTWSSSPNPLTVIVTDSTTLVNGTTYNIWLRAVNTAGAGSISSYKSVTPTAINTGYVTLLAGNVKSSGITDGGKGTNVKFNAPRGIAVNETTGVVYVADRLNNVIRQIGTDGTVTLFAGKFNTSGTADGKGTIANFNQPYAVSVNNTTGVVYVADGLNNMIRTISPDGTVATLAGKPSGGSGNGKGTNAGFNTPSGIAVNNTTGVVYVADQGNNSIRTIGIDGTVSTLRTGITSAFGVAVKESDTTLYTVADKFIYTLNSSGSTIATNSLTDNTKSWGVSVNQKTGVVYVANYQGNKILAITNGVISTYAGKTTSGAESNVYGTNASFDSPLGIVVNRNTAAIYVSDSNNQVIRLIQ